MQRAVAPRASAWLGAGLVAISFALFAGALGNAYVLDGALLVRDNPLLAPFEPLRIAGLDWWAGSGRPGGLYRPVSLVSLAGLRALGGGEPGWINFANVALHGAVAWLHFALFLRFLGPRSGAQAVAWLAALMALVHPLNAEVIGGQVGMADLLAALFMCAAVLVASEASRLRFALGALFAFMAALSKESGVLVLPLAALFEALRFSSAPDARRRVARALAWSGLGVGCALACRYGAIGSLASVDDPVYAGFSALARAASASATFATHSIPLVFAPWRQLAVVSLQEAPPASGFGDPRAIGGALMLLALIVAPVFALRRGRRDVAFGAWFFLASWLPGSNLLFSSGAVAASRFFYAGLAGLCLPLALSLVQAWSAGRFGRIAAGLLAAWFVAVLSLVAWRETAIWRSERGLLEAQVARAPASMYGLIDLATSIQEQDPARALALLGRAAETELPLIPGQEFPPEDLLESLYMAHFHAAQIQESMGEGERAHASYRAAEALAERGRQARRVLPFREDWNRHRSLSLQRLAAGSLERAKTLAGAELASALDAAQRDLDALDATDPESSESVRLRSILLQRRGDPAGRARLIEEAWRKRPDDHLLRILWANELRQRGRQAEALALELDVAAKAFDAFDPARGLAIAKEGLASSDAGIVAGSRALLERLVRLDPRRDPTASIRKQAAQLLTEQGARGN